MAKQEIQISSVKLINGGLKGLEIKYLEINDVNSNLYKSEVTKKNRRPVNIDMQLKFEEFKDHLAELCSIDEGKLSITGITAGHDKFLISGTVEVLDKKKSAINTPCIKEEDGYDKYEEVQSKVDSIYKMVLEYMEKEAYTATNEQMILQFNKGKEGFDPEAVKNMTDAEKVVEATKFLEKTGCVVLNPNEEDMPGGITDEEESDFEDISAGDEKEELFAEEKEFLEKTKDILPTDFGVTEDETTNTATIDIERATKEDTEKLIQAAKIAEEKKQKAQDQLAKLKDAQAKLEESINEDDDFIPMRKVV